MLNSQELIHAKKILKSAEDFKNTVIDKNASQAQITDMMMSFWGGALAGTNTLLSIQDDNEDLCVSQIEALVLTIENACKNIHKPSISN